MTMNIDDLMPLAVGSRAAGVTPQGGSKLFSRIGAVVVIGGLKFVDKAAVERVKAAREVLQQGRGRPPKSRSRPPKK